MAYCIHPFIRSQRRHWESAIRALQWLRSISSWGRKGHWLETLWGTQGSRPHPRTAGCYSSPASRPGTGPSEEGPGAATPPTWSPRPHPWMTGFPVITESCLMRVFLFDWLIRNIKEAVLLILLWFWHQFRCVRLFKHITRQFSDTSCVSYNSILTWSTWREHQMPQGKSPVPWDPTSTPL